MPISLDDLRKTISYSRKDKQRRIEPLLLGTAEELQLAQDFGEYFAELARNGRKQSDFSEQYLTERAGGDFKLARGLISTVLRVYVWESDSFAERLNGEDWTRLQKWGLEGSSELRLALYDYVSEVNAGFVTSAERAESLELFGAGLGLPAEKVEELLFLDSEANARLKLRTRKDGQLFRIPTAPEIVRDYNRLAVETLLFNSSEIIFSFASLPGALLKRIGFLSKIYRVPYDLDLNALGEVRLRLYGPPEAFGAATKYGESLAHLTFATLKLAQTLSDDEAIRDENKIDFSGPHTTLLIPSSSSPTPIKKLKMIETGDAKATKSVARAKKVKQQPFLVGAAATVHIKGKLFNFNLLQVWSALALAAPPTETTSDSPASDENFSYTAKASTGNQVAETKAVYSVGATPLPKKTAPEEDFDSSVEARFYQQWAALEREGQSAGWRLEREPEAITIPSENLIFVPDFMLVRGKQRIFLEIIGFWTPAYRARKLEKLEKLKQHGDYKLLLATAQELKADFQQALFPTIFYKNFLKPTDILSLLQKEYADFDERLEAAVGARAMLVSQLETNQYITEDRLYTTLQCYNKTELTNAIQRLGMVSHYIEGYGLCTAAYLEKMGLALQVVLKTCPKISLEQAIMGLAHSGLPFDEARAEALLERLPGFRLNRLSLFDVFLTIA